MPGNRRGAAAWVTAAAVLLAGCGAAADPASPPFPSRASASVAAGLTAFGATAAAWAAHHTPTTADNGEAAWKMPGAPAGSYYLMNGNNPRVIGYDLFFGAPVTETVARADVSAQLPAGYTVLLDAPGVPSAEESSCRMLFLQNPDAATTSNASVLWAEFQSGSWMNWTAYNPAAVSDVLIVGLEYAAYTLMRATSSNGVYSC